MDTKLILRPPLFWCLVFASQLPMLLVYFFSLSSSPLYGAMPFSLIAAGLFLLVQRRPGSPQLPNSMTSQIITGLGLLSAFCAAASGLAWFAVLGLVGTSLAFLFTHDDPKNAKLMPLAYLLVPLVRLPLGGDLRLTESLKLKLIESADSLMTIANMPHVVFGDAVVFRELRIYFDQLVYSQTGWPTFLAIAMLHSAFWNRNLPVALCNLISAFVWYAVFCVAIVMLRGYAATHLIAALQPGTFGFYATHVAAAGIAYLLFVSAERGFRGLFMPITEGPGDARMANPLVLAWNWCLAGAEVRKRKRSDYKGWRQAWWPMVGSGIVVLLLLTQLFQSGNLAVGSWRNRSTQPQLMSSSANAVFEDMQPVDYRLAAQPTPSAIEVWNCFQPSFVSEFRLTDSPTTASSLIAEYTSQGWSQVGDTAESTINLNSAETLIAHMVTFKRDRRRARLDYAWIGNDGFAPTQNDQSVSLLSSFTWLQSKSRQSLESKLNQLFERFCRTISSRRQTPTS